MPGLGHIARLPWGAHRRRAGTAAIELPAVASRCGIVAGVPTAENAALHAEVHDGRGAPPEWPAAANLTPVAGSALARYPDAESMIAMFRSGRRPDGSAVSTVMPFGGLKAMSDIDVRALFLHLKGLPARPSGER